MSEAAPTAAKPFTARLWAIHLWGLGGMADYFLYSAFNMINLAFTTGYKLDPVLVGIALSAPRFIDALVDPLIGHFSDDFHSRWGRRRPFILGSSVIGALLVMGLWWDSPAWNQWVQLAWVTVGATLLFTMWGIFNLTHTALGYELSDDYGNRSKVLAIKGWWATVAMIGGSYVYSGVLNMPAVLDHVAGAAHWCLGGQTGIDVWLDNGVAWLRPQVGTEVGAFRLIYIFVALVIVFGGLVPFLTVKERFSRANRKHVALWPAMRATFQNKTYRLLLILRISQTFGTALSGITGAYLAIYYICYGDKKWYMAVAPPCGTFVGLVLALAMMFLAAPITRKLGKRTGLIVCFGLMFLSTCFAPLIYQPGHLYLVVFYGLCFAPVAMVLNNLSGSLIPDICDVDELEHGERREGLFAAVQSFVNKMETSTIMLFSGFLLKFSGFDQHIIVQPPEVLHRMLWMYFTPSIFFAGVTFVISWFIPPDQKNMAAVRAELDARRAAGLTQETGKPTA